PQIILGADYLVDLGPNAGSHGGELVFCGSPAELGKDGARSQTARFLANGARNNLALPAEIHQSEKPERSKQSDTSHKFPAITICGAREHNLKRIDATIPLHRFVCVTGVSGSGKSTLIHGVLYEAFSRKSAASERDV